jgi:hypothetical protein
MFRCCIQYLLYLHFVLSDEKKDRHHRNVRIQRVTYINLFYLMMVVYKEQNSLGTYKNTKQQRTSIEIDD